MKYLLIVVLVLAGCSASEDDYERGLDDGYAAGYNTTCEIRSTMISGDWDNKDYSRGYQAGYAEGSQECLSGRK